MKNWSSLGTISKNEAVQSSGVKYNKKQALLGDSARDIQDRYVNMHAEHFFNYARNVIDVWCLY